jgi:8-oxo-dGTP pyrophosphatase MutT (NUDIX family)
MLNFMHSVLNGIYRILQCILGFKTLGPRAIVVNAQQQVLLIKQTYTKGWHLPGGGVKRGESVPAGLRRELQEEVGITLSSEPRLFGIYQNRFMGGDDYPIIYVVKNYSQILVKSAEIAQQSWFHFAELPSDVSPGTRQRLEEFFKALPVSESW